MAACLQAPRPGNRLVVALGERVVARRCVSAYKLSALIEPGRRGGFIPPGSSDRLPRDETGLQLGWDCLRPPAGACCYRPL